MLCSFDANPPNVTEVVWYKDGSLIGESLRLRKSISSENGFPALAIYNITRNDTGFYSCHLKNAFGRGNSTTSTYVDVLCKSV